VAPSFTAIRDAAWACGIVTVSPCLAVVLVGSLCRGKAHKRLDHLIHHQNHLQHVLCDDLLVLLCLNMLDL
jgi:hypothetical protein